MMTFTMLKWIQSRCKPHSPCSLTLRIEACESLHGQKLEVLGWYHSHPFFETIPSYIDKDAQTNYQKHYGNQPFLGFIIGPYTKESYRRGSIDLVIFCVNQGKVYKLKYDLCGQTHISKGSLDRIFLRLREMVKQAGKERTEGIIPLDTKGKQRITYKEQTLCSIESMFRKNLEKLRGNGKTKRPRPNLTKGDDVAIDDEGSIASFLSYLEKLLDFR
eukprot:TRINITY_DN2533_c0_g1_i7.p1 TRINITY_DN2533_c0_g1~~TRINITY_DN2533_c0_g1_i7.p1  ORF type:complete len:217 (-),score=22.24 TRINITY_DN2533_c0_g1_i7:120-770(-)